MKMVIPWEGGVRGSQNLRGSSASFKVLTTRDSKKIMIYMQFSYFVTQASSPSFWIRPPLGIYRILIVYTLYCTVFIVKY